MGPLLCPHLSPILRRAILSFRILPERSSPSRVRCAAPNNGAPLTAPGRSERTLAEKRERLIPDGRGHHRCQRCQNGPFFRCHRHLPTYNLPGTPSCQRCGTCVSNGRREERPCTVRWNQDAGLRCRSPRCSHRSPKAMPEAAQPECAPSVPQEKLRRSAKPMRHPEGGCSSHGCSSDLMLVVCVLKTGRTRYFVPLLITVSFPRLFGCHADLRISVRRSWRSGTQWP